jgi:hypothetical protein
MAGVEFALGMDAAPMPARLRAYPDVAALHSEDIA